MLYLTFPLLLLFMSLIILRTTVPELLTDERMAVLAMLGSVVIGGVCFVYFTKHYKLSAPFHFAKVYKEAGWMATRLIAVSLGLVLGGLVALVLIWF